MWTPYARRKSHNKRTSESGGVQAEKVRTATLAFANPKIYMETRTIPLEDSFVLNSCTVWAQFDANKCPVTSLNDLTRDEIPSIHDEHPPMSAGHIQDTQS